MYSRIKEIEERYNELESELGRPEIIQDQQKRLGHECYFIDECGQERFERWWLW